MDARGEHKPRQQKAGPKREVVAAPGGAPATAKATWWEKPTGSGSSIPPKARSDRPRGGKPSGQQRQRATA